MRAGLLVFGLVLLIVGAALLFVPLVTQVSQTITDSSPYAANVTGFSLTGTVAFTLTWTSASSVTVLAESCSSIDVSAADPCQGPTTIGSQAGTSGSTSFALKPGATLFIGASNASGPASADITLKSTLSTVGSIFLVVGVLLVIAGVVIKKKAPPAPSPGTPPQP